MAAQQKILQKLLQQKKQLMLQQTLQMQKQQTLQMQKQQTLQKIQQQLLTRHGLLQQIQYSSLLNTQIQTTNSLVSMLISLQQLLKIRASNMILQSLGWDAAVAAVQAGQADAIMAGASITQERKDNGWIFSDGYYNATQTFVVAQGSDVKSFEDLKGKNVAVKNGTQGADYANSLKDQYGFTVTVFEDSPTMYQDVILGNSAACVEDTPIIKTSIKEGELALEVPEGMENEGADYGVGIMNADNQEFLDMFNAGLANIKANGKYDEIIAKYLD